VLTRRQQQTVSWPYLTTTTTMPPGIIRTGTMVGPITVALASAALLMAGSLADFTITTSTAAGTQVASTVAAGTAAAMAADARPTLALNAACKQHSEAAIPN
jgi:hypothetical protein